MLEEEVNENVREWLESEGFDYKGVTKGQPKKIHTPGAKPHRGEIPVLTGEGRDVLIDHQGVKYRADPPEIMWIEAKGKVNTSTLLEGFIRLLSAVYYGGGDGLLAVPPERRKYLQEHWWDFLKSTSKAAVGRGRIGIFDAGEKKAYWLEAER